MSLIIKKKKPVIRSGSTLKYIDKNRSSQLSTACFDSFSINGRIKRISHRCW
jgi:hypothetical protein